MENNKINEGALTKQIKTLVMQERYEEAMKVLDEIEVSKIRNISILCLVGEVYMGLKRYDEAEQILLRVYEKNPNTRRILDLLTTLYIDKGEYSEAEYYYKEFIGVASRDLHRYILRYRLDKGKGERLSVLIDTLEKLKDYEYIEEWETRSRFWKSIRIRNILSAGLMSWRLYMRPAVRRRNAFMNVMRSCCGLAMENMWTRPLR